MITYFDTSSLLKFIIKEIGSEENLNIWNFSDEKVCSQLTRTEMHSALMRKVREGSISASAMRARLNAMDKLFADVILIDITSDVIDASCELVKEFPLKSADAIHLATALMVRADLFSSSDKKLCAAASESGIAVTDPTEG
jgi:predicted nucleic acid-binding protein